MKTNEVKHLLNSFYEGATTPEEELLLRNYFNSGEVEQELLDEKNIFLSLEQSEIIDVPNHLASQLDTLISNLDRENHKRVSFSTKTLIRWVSVAACIALLTTASFYLFHPSMSNHDQTLVEDIDHEPEVDIIQVEKALALLSNNFNKGMKQIDGMQSNFEKTNAMLEEIFK